VRFEDICDKPELEVRRIVDFIDGPADRLVELISLVKKPKSIGRWREYKVEDVEKVVSIGREYLIEFDYI